MANVLGKRYMCEKCGTEVLCNKAGPGGLEVLRGRDEDQGSQTASKFRLESPDAAALGRRRRRHTFQSGSRARESRPGSSRGFRPRPSR